jgi:hypothetical protein
LAGSFIFSCSGGNAKRADKFFTTLAMQLAQNMSEAGGMSAQAVAKNSIIAQHMLGAQ